MNNIITRLLEFKINAPDKEAIVWECWRGKREITFDRLFGDVLATAEYFRSRGLRQGDSVLVFVPMSLGLYKTLLALFYLGVTAVFVDAWADRRRLAQAIAIARPRAFIGSPKAQLLRLLSPPIRKVPMHLMVGDTWPRAKKAYAAADFRPAPTSPDDAALVTFTTGSTGMPKAARRTHRFLWTQHEVVSGHMVLKPADLDLCVFPVFVLSDLAAGVTSFLPAFDPRRPDRVKPSVISRQILRFGVTTFKASPDFSEKLADFVLRKNIHLPLRSIFIGGAAVYPELADKLVRAFPGTEVEIVYGSTEAEPISGAPAREVAAADTSYGLPVGKPVPELRVAILRPQEPLEAPVQLKPGESLMTGSPRLAATGEIGEIIVAGPHVLREYVNSPDDFKKNKIVDGEVVWHRTGDAGLLDEQGDLRLFGRVKHRISWKGKLYYAFPLEARLRRLPGVRFAAALLHGGRPKFVLETVTSLSDSERDSLKRLARDSGGELRDAVVVCVETIPRDPRHHSKVDYDRLLQLL